MQNLSETTQAPPLVTLTTQQATVKNECLKWLRKPQGNDKFRVIRGFAGSGKTFLIRQIIEDFRADGLEAEFDKNYQQEHQDALDAFKAGFLSCEPKPPKGAIAGCAPTHKAKEVLLKATGDMLDSASTVQSLFALQLRLIKFTKQDQARLDLLQKTEGLTEAEEKQRDGLLLQREAAENKKRELFPTGRLDLTGIRLIIIDECSMLGEFLLSQILKAVFDGTAHPDLQVIFMGDPFQLPPIGEVKSQVFRLTTFPELTEIVRYDGSILKYAEAIRDRPPNLQGLHYAFVNKTPDLATLDYRDAIIQGAKMIQDGEDIMFIAATNKAVDSINQVLRNKIKGADMDYDKGDRLLSRQSIERRKCLDVGMVPQCKFGRGSYCTSCDMADTEIGTSAFLVVTEVIQRDTFVTALGSELRRTKCFVKDAAPDGKHYATPIYLCHPEDTAQWVDDIKALQGRVSAFFSRSKKMPRGQEGGFAKEIWDKEGLKNWAKKLDGSALSESEYRSIRGRYFNEMNACKEAFDSVSLAYCATVNRMQGVTVKTVAIHTPSIFQALKFGGAGDSSAKAWDPYRLLYTAVTRAAGQLVLIE